MEARHPSRHWTRLEKLWLLAFIVAQLAALWECFGRWWFVAAFAGRGDVP